MTPELERSLDKAKAKVFGSSTSAFKGPLMCGMDFVWDEDLPSVAATDYVRVFIKPSHWARLPEQTQFEVLEHELDHAGRLHGIRRGSRDPLIWNYACDYAINNGLVADGAKFEGLHPLIDKQYAGMAEEAIYDLLAGPDMQLPSQGSWGDGEPDLKPLNEADKERAINNVQRAIVQADLLNNPGSVPGGLREIIEYLLTPQVPWERLLINFFTDMQDRKQNWGRPNRRYTDIYLPSWEDDDGRLESLAFFFDISGSVTSKMLQQFRSEIYYIRSVLKPKKVTLVMFNTQIAQVIELGEEVDPRTPIVLEGRGGGTHVECVRQWIDENKPSAAAIMTDMWFDPMKPLKSEVPIFWIAINNRKAKVPFGTIVHVRA